MSGDPSGDLGYMDSYLISNWVPKGRRSFQRSLTCWWGGKDLIPSNPALPLWSLRPHLPLLWGESLPAFFLIPLRILLTQVLWIGMPPLALRDASLSFIFLKAKRILTWEGDTSNVKNSKARKYPNSLGRNHTEAVSTGQTTDLFFSWLVSGHYSEAFL